jgi:hypothetical protein
MLVALVALVVLLPLVLVVLDGLLLTCCMVQNFALVVVVSSICNQ